MLLIAVWLIPLVSALTLHEAAHALVASLLGDSTPRHHGRLSLNPMRHISAIGTIAIPALTIATMGIAIGWCKPVPVNLAQLAKRHGGVALMAAAGPLANLVLAALWLTLLRYVDLGPGITAQCSAGVIANTSLLLFNLLPVPPLDGWRIWRAL